MTQEYLSMFIDETREHLQAWSDGLLELEQQQDTTEVSVIFRAAHTIKGMAMTMGFQRMGDVTHRAENLLDGIRQGIISVNSDIVDVLFKSLDLLEHLLDEIEETGSEPNIDTETVVAVIEQLSTKSLAATTAETGAAVDGTTLALSTAAEQSSEASPARYVADVAVRDGYRVFEMSLDFESTCKMPMARWAQVIQQLNPDNVLYTEPEAVVLDAGDYKGPIRFAWATEDDVETIGERIAAISEVIVLSIEEWRHPLQSSVHGQVLPTGNLTADPHVFEVIQSALQKGVFVFEVGIRLHPNTALKGARLYMVFEAIGGQDQLLFTDPSMADIEQERVDTDVQFIMWSNEQVQAVREAIENVSEVELVELREWQNRQGEPTRGANAVAQKHNSERKTIRKSTSTVRVDTDKLDALMNLFSELVIDKTRLDKIQEDLDNNELSQTVAHMSRIADELQDIVMNIRMVPVSTIFTRFPRMVRDTALQLGKEVDFEVSGQDTELDRTVVEEIGDPIMHMLRNSLDHGIESAEARGRAGKPATGHIALRAYSSGNSVFVEVEDDGGGIDSAHVWEKAHSKGLVDAATPMTDDQVYQLLFASGFSTSDEVSDLSGRGVGLDVVKAKIEALSGRVELQSEKGKGTKFIVQLPMTLAIMQGLMVSVDDNPYLLPLGSVVQVESGVETKTLDGREVALWRDEVVPFVRLREVFGLGNHEGGHTVFIRRGSRTLGLMVDDVLGQQQVVLKTLDKRLRTVKWLSGGTILGDGTVALVLDSNSFF